jgi:hypothetical protein
METVAIVGAGTNSLGTISDILVSVNVIRALGFANGLVLTDNAEVIIKTFITIGANSGTTHLTFNGTTQGNIQISGFSPTVQSNEFAFDFDTGTTFSGVATIMGCTMNDADLVFAATSYDNTTVGFKFLGNSNIPDSTSNAKIGALDEGGTQTLLDQNKIKRINATFSEVSSERFETNSIGNVEYVGFENVTAQLMSTITGTVSTGTNVNMNFFVVKGNSLNTIVSAANPGGGQVTITTSLAHGYSNGDRILQENTTSYNNEYVIAEVTSTTYEITETFVATETGTHGKAILTTKASNDFSGANKNTMLMAHAMMSTNDWMYVAVENTDSTAEWEIEGIQELYSQI